MKFIIIPIIGVLLAACSATPQKVENKKQVVVREQASNPSDEQQENETTVVASNDTIQVAPTKDSPKKGIEAIKNPKTPKNPVVPSKPVDVQLNTPVVEEVPVQQVNFQDYETYESLLKDAVSASGKVNYVKLKSRKADLDAVVAEFQANVPENSWSYKQKLAYWINAYNVFTLQIVVENYPLKSIKDIGGSSSTWDKKFIDLDGKKMSLNDIENGIIRKQFSEPRIHFAVNCASVSCPKLYNRAFTASELESQLTKLAKEFLADDSKNTLDSNNPKISKLFDWYQDDFKAGGGVAAFLSKYSSVEVSTSSKITYSEYNWNLNN